MCVCFTSFSSSESWVTCSASMNWVRLRERVPFQSATLRLRGAAAQVLKSPGVMPLPY